MEGLNGIYETVTIPYSLLRVAHPLRVFCAKGGRAQLSILTVNIQTENAVARIGRPNELLTAMTSGLLFNFQAGRNFGEDQKGSEIVREAGIPALT